MRSIWLMCTKSSLIIRIIVESRNCHDEKKKPKVINKEIKILDHIKPRTISLTEQCHRVVISLCSFFIRSPSIPIVLL